MKRLEKLFTEAKRQIKEAGITIASDVILSADHMRSSKALASTTRLNDAEYVVRLSEYFLENDDEEIIEMMVHELLHTVDECFNHGTRWNHYADIMNKREGYDIARTTKIKMKTIEEQGDDFYKYIIRCNGCDQKIRRQRKSKFIRELDRYHCTRCGGSFYIAEER